MTGRALARDACRVIGKKAAARDNGIGVREGICRIEEELLGSRGDADDALKRSRWREDPCAAPRSCAGWMHVEAPGS